MREGAVVKSVLMERSCGRGWSAARRELPVPEEGWLQKVLDADASAQTAAGRAENGGGLTGLNARAETLDQGAEAQVRTEDGADGARTLIFGIPQGKTGPKGVKGDKRAMRAQKAKRRQGATRAIPPRGEQGAKGEKGDRGLPGTGLTIAGYYEDAAALNAAVKQPEIGAAYGVGAQAPYSIYIWTGAAGWTTALCRAQKGEKKNNKGRCRRARRKGRRAQKGEKEGETGAAGPAGSARETAADDSLIKGRGRQGSAGRIGRGLRGGGAQPGMSDVSGLEAALGGKQPKNCCCAGAAVAVSLDGRCAGAICGLPQDRADRGGGRTGETCCRR